MMASKEGRRGIAGAPILGLPHLADGVLTTAIPDDGLQIYGCTVRRKQYDRLLQQQLGFSFSL